MNPFLRVSDLSNGQRRERTARPPRCVARAPRPPRVSSARSSESMGASESEALLRVGSSVNRSLLESAFPTVLESVPILFEGVALVRLSGRPPRAPSRARSVLRAWQMRPRAGRPRRTADSRQTQIDPARVTRLPWLDHGLHGCPGSIRAGILDPGRHGLHGCPEWLDPGRHSASGLGGMFGRAGRVLLSVEYAALPVLAHREAGACSGRKFAAPSQEHKEVGSILHMFRASGQGGRPRAEFSDCSPVKRGLLPIPRRNGYRLLPPKEART